MIRFNQPLDSHDWFCKEMAYGCGQPLRSWSTIVVCKRDNLTAREKCTRIPRAHRPSHVRMPVIYRKSKVLSMSSPDVETLIDNNNFEVAEFLSPEALH